MKEEMRINEFTTEFENRKETEVIYTRGDRQENYWENIEGCCSIFCIKYKNEGPAEELIKAASEMMEDIDVQEPWELRNAGFFFRLPKDKEKPALLCTVMPRLIPQRIDETALAFARAARRTEGKRLQLYHSPEEE